MAREYFKCFHSYFEKTKSLTDAEVGRLFRALLKFSATGEAPSLAGRESIAFDFIADEIVRDQDAYAQLCRQNAQNRAQRPSTTVNDRERNATEGYETDKVEGIRNKKEISPNGDTKKKGFQPPSLEEVKARCEALGYKVNPEAFIAHYQSVGWKVGKNPMKDWQAALAGWNARENPMFRSVKDDMPKRKKNPALTYSQRPPMSQEEFLKLCINLDSEEA